MPIDGQRGQNDADETGLQQQLVRLVAEYVRDLIERKVEDPLHGECWQQAASDRNYAGNETMGSEKCR